MSGGNDSVVCDGINDCGDMSDESYCGESRKVPFTFSSIVCSWRISKSSGESSKNCTHKIISCSGIFFFMNQVAD